MRDLWVIPFAIMFIVAAGGGTAIYRYNKYLEREAAVCQAKGGTFLGGKVNACFRKDVLL